MGRGYGRFAKHYDLLTGNVSYKERGEYFHRLIERFGNGSKNPILLDLGCGTGSLSEVMAGLGYDVIGVDISEEMLTEALNKKYASGLNIQYLCQDMRRLDMYGTVDVTLSALDSVNHLSGIEDVKAAFSKVSLFSNPGGLFIFDLNTPYKHREILGFNTFFMDTPSVSCVWQNCYMMQGKNNGVVIRLDFFEPCSDGRYERYTEEFPEFAYELEDIKSLLAETGFEVLAVYGEDTEEPPEEDTLRINIVARKL